MTEIYGSRYGKSERTLVRIPARIAFCKEVDSVWQLVFEGLHDRWLIPMPMPEGLKAGDVLFVDLVKPMPPPPPPDEAAAIVV